MQQDLVAHNWFATVALLSWPLISLVLYSQLSLSKATIWTLLGALLLLPVDLAFKIPMLPQIDKSSIASICVLVGCVAFGRISLWRFKRFGVAETLLLVYIFSPIITSELNNDYIVVGDRVLPGVGLYDAASAVMAAAIFMIPFVVGRRLFSQTAHLRDAFQILVYSQLAYSILLLFEIRFSPQLHNWIYGYLPGQFLQSIRFDGYRPMAFMGHGLQAALFLAMSIIAAAALWRSRSASKVPATGAFAYLSVVLILCKSLGSTIYALIISPLVLFAQPRLQMKVAVVLASIALVYPILRTFDFFPTALMVEAAGSFSADRAESLDFRFQNENQLLSHALQRPVFGWGRYGRNRIFDEATGKDMSTTDGRWIITLGQFGILGFVAEFGLLAMGVFRAYGSLRYTQSRTDQILTAALSLIVAMNLIDMLPNSSIVPWTLMLCGALLGRAELLRSTAGRTITPSTTPARRLSSMPSDRGSSSLSRVD